MGSHAVYSEDFSLIGNPFDSRLGRVNLQMTRLFILAALVQFSTDSAFEYLDGIEIKRVLRLVGVPDEYSLKVLEDLCRFRFIHTASHDKPSFKSNFYPSRLGGYIVRELIGNVTFVENVLMDTFISCDETWEKLYELGKEASNASGDVVYRLELRMEKVKVFFGYIEALYSVLLGEAHKRSVPKEWKTNPFENGRLKLTENSDRAIASAKRNYR